MLDIDEMGQKEIHELLHKEGYGHFGCIVEGYPYSEVKWCLMKQSHHL